jgi:hypothetical protein
MFPVMQFRPAIPTRGTKVPTSPDWIHEIKFDGFRLRLPLFHFEQRIIGWHHRNDRGENLVPPPIMVRTMDQSYFREQADRCRHLAQDSTDFALQVRLRKLANDYQMRADEIEDDEIFSAKGADKSTY